MGKAYGLLLLNFEGVRRAVTRVGALPLQVQLGSEVRGFVCLPVQADSSVKAGIEAEHRETADTGNKRGTRRDEGLLTPWAATF